jgi:hypothetical protein
MKTKLRVDSILVNTLKFLVIIVFIFSGITTKAQQDSSYKNTIRFNVTNPMIFGDKAVILGYERVLKNNKTFSINVGRAYYPKLSGLSLDSSGLELNNSYKDKGLNVSADYRIYLKKENKYAAPRGVYIGPYYSYNYFNRVNSWTLNTEDFQGDLETDLTMNIHTAGIELGYQFVFWNRISLDMILLGPGISFYNFKVKIDTSLSPEDESLFFEELNNFLSEKIPGYDLVIDDVEFKKTGSVKTTTLGFRYMIMIGYRF